MIRREALCFGLAMIFTTMVVVPGILIFWDRSPPFQYIDALVPEKAVHAGDAAHVRITINKVQKDCRGRVERYFFDSTGRAFFLGESPVIYFRAIEERRAGAFERRWLMPADAAPGEGYYVFYPEFWCNPVQYLYPIKPGPQKARVTVLPPLPPRAPAN